MINKAYAKKVAVLVSGAGLSQLINLMMMPYVTRLYGPSVYGAFGYYSALISFLVPLVTLAYPLGLVLSKSNTELRVFFRLILKVIFLMSCVIFMALFFISYMSFFDVPLKYPYILITIGVFLSSFLLLYTQYGIKLERFKKISQSMIIMAVVGSVAKIVLGLYQPVAFSLVLSNYIAVSSQVLYLFFSLGRIQSANLSFFSITKKERFLSKKYIQFPVYRMPHAIASELIHIVPVIMFSVLYDSSKVGFYILAKTALSVPAMLVGKAIYDVSYPTINSRFIAGEGNFDFILRVTLFSVAIVFIPILAIWNYGNILFSVIFGDEWERAGVYASFLSVWYALNVVNKACASSVSVYKLDGYILKNTVMTFLLGLLGFLCGHVFFKTDVASIALYATGAVFVQAIFILNILRKIRVIEKSII